MAFTDEVPPKERSRWERYPDSKQVLLWIGSSIGIIITATWLMINEKVNSHAHAEYAKSNDIYYISDTQVSMQQQINSLAVDIRDQNKILLEMYHRWQAQPGR